MKKNKGFTLVELMVVIVIIGILAALAIQKLLAATSKAKLAEFKPTLKTIYTLSETYFTEKGAYPTASAMGADNADIGYKKPVGGNFQYDVKKPASDASGAGTAGVISSAEIAPNKSLKLSNATVLAAGDNVACVDVDGVQFGTDAQIIKDAGLSNSTVLACP